MNDINKDNGKCLLNLDILSPQGKIYNSVMDNWETIEYCYCEPYIDLMRFIFIPPVEKHVTTLMQHWMCGHEACEILIRDLRCWLRSSFNLSRTLIIRGVPRLFIDSVLLTNRIHMLGSECYHLGLYKIILSIACHYFRRFECWINQDRYTRPRASVSCMNDQTKTSTKQSRKRKRPCDDVFSSSSDSGSDPLDILPSSWCGREPRRPPSGREVCEEPASRASRCHKLRLIVTEPRPGSGCRIRGRMRRTDYISLPCNSNALREKIFGCSEFLSSTPCKVPDNFHRFLRCLCTSLNGIISRMNAKTINDLILICDIRKKYIGFKLQTRKSKVCKFCTEFELAQKNIKKLHGRRIVTSPSHSEGCLKRINTDERVICTTMEPAKSARFTRLMRCLSSPGRKKRVTYFCNQDASCQSKSNFNYKQGSASCIHSCKVEELIERFKANIEKMQENSISECAKIKFQDTGIITVESSEAYNLQQLFFKNGETATESVDDNVEVMDMDLNDISLCHCGNEDGSCDYARRFNNEEITEIGINTDSCWTPREHNGEHTCSSSCKDINTNMVCTRSKENITQQFLDNICNLQLGKSVTCICKRNNCTCGKFNFGNIGKNFLKNSSPAKKCYSKVVKDFGGITHSEFIENIQCELGEIVSITARIREKCMVPRQGRDKFCLSNKRLRKQISPHKLDLKLRISSRGSPRSNNNCVQDQKGTSKCLKPCESSLCDYKKLLNDNSRLRKYVFTKFKVPIENLASHSVNNMYQNKYFQMRDSGSCCCIEHCSQVKLLYYAQYCMDSGEFFSRKKENRVKKFSLVHFVSYQLRRQTFNNCVRLIRLMYRGILRRGKMLTNVHRSWYRCRYCSMHYRKKPRHYECKFHVESNAANFPKASQSSDRHLHHKENKRTRRGRGRGRGRRQRRLSGGTDLVRPDNRKCIAECDPKFPSHVPTSKLDFSKVDSCNLNYCANLNLKNRNKNRRKKLYAVEKSFHFINRLTEPGVRDNYGKDYLKRSKRIQDFTAEWSYPYGAYAKYFYYLR